MNYLRGTLFTILLVVSLACGTENEQRQALKAPGLDALLIGHGEFNIPLQGQNTLTLLSYRSSHFDSRSGPIWFVMHGASRDAERYLALATSAAERYGALVLVPHFPKSQFPSNQSYSFGIGHEDRIGQHFELIEQIFDLVKNALGGRQSGYFMFGHSAGAQLTHRFVTYMPNSRLLGAVAANAGWYTLPVSRPGSNYAFPYGLGGQPVEPVSQAKLFAKPLTILVGEYDTETPELDRLVRGTEEAMAQGNNRLQRGRNYFEMGMAEASNSGLDFNWRFNTVSRARHKARQLVDSAAYYLFASRNPCQLTSDNSNLLITELLINPPNNQHGDANRDGVRDAQDDEFISVTNKGDESACIAGWALSDAERVRHVFPIGSEIAPKASLIVFGGGVPKLPSLSLDSQTALFDGTLSLTNDGDVVSLTDNEGAVMDQISWGDCGKRQCARNHVSNEVTTRSLIRVQNEFENWHTSNGPYSWLNEE